MQSVRPLLAVALALVTALAVACSSASGGTVSVTSAGGYQPQKVASPVTLLGAGASFPAPFYTKAFYEYHKFDPNVKANYQSIGSSGGVKNFTEGTVDFGASDSPMNDKQLTAVGGAEDVFHIPTAAGAVVLTYNLEGYTGGLRLTSETLTAIYLGEIRRWNDPRLRADNADAPLPDTEIVVVRRSDGSGTTKAFTNYLSAVSPTWKEQVGAANSVQWPVGVGASGNDGVTGQVKQSPGAIGYVELSYADANQLPVAAVQNQAGNFITPSLDSTSAALADLTSLPDDLRAVIINPSPPDAYPIPTLTFILVHREQPNQLKASALVNLLWWLTHDGQQVAIDLHYAPLPKEMQAKVEEKLRLISVKGQPVLS